MAIFLNFWPDRTGPGFPPDTPDKSYFDFFVSERPIYVAGSGPPLAPVTPMPVHDRAGIILEKIKHNSSYLYLVGYDDNPGLRVGVKLENILDWVSPRTLESFEYEAMKRRQQEEEKALIPKINSMQIPNGQKSEPLSRAKTLKKASRRRRRRPASFTKHTVLSKRDPLVAQPITRRRVSMKEIPTFQSPRESQLSQPSLSTPGSRKRGLAEPVLSDSEEESTELALEHQFITDLTTFHDGPSNRQAHRTSLGLLDQLEKNSSAKTSLSRHKFIDNDCRSLSLASKNGKGDRSPPESSLSGWQDANTGSSSREGLQRGNEDIGSIKPGDTIASRYNKLIASVATPRSPKHFISQSKAFSTTESELPQARANSRGFLPVAVADSEDDDNEEEEERDDDEDDDEESYEVEKIIDEQVRSLPDGTRCLHYLIKWIGDWDDTWVPYSNVGGDAISEYRKNRKQKQRATDKTPFVAERRDNDKYKKALNTNSNTRIEHVRPVVRRSAYFDEDDEDDEIGECFDDFAGE